jgi:hypothetical protein
MEAAIVNRAIAFVRNRYGLDGPNIAAQVDAVQQSGWHVTVWIGRNLYQRVVVAIDGSVQQLAAADGGMRRDQQF